MKIYSIVFLLLLSIGAQAQTYVRNFEAKASSKDVGYTTAKKIVNGDVTEYDIKSIVRVEILFTITVEYKAQAFFKGGVLISSSASVHVNGHLQNSVITEKDGDHYNITSDGHVTKLYGDILFSTAKMYFQPPMAVNSVYCESEGVMKDVVKTSDGKFRVKDPSKDDDSTTYGYSSEQGVYNILVVKEHLPDLTLKMVKDIPKVDLED